MTDRNDNREAMLAGLVDAHLAYLEGAAPPPAVDALPEDVRAEAHERIRLLEALWGNPIEELTAVDDPVARRLGFDHTGGTIVIDGRAVARHRRAAGVDLAAFTGIVNNAGGETTVQAMWQLEQEASVELPQPLVSAIVAALDSSVDALSPAHAPTPNPIRRFLDSPRFTDLITQWARDHHRPVSQVRELVTGRVLATQFRAEDVTPDQLEELVRVTLRSLEP